MKTVYMEKLPVCNGCKEESASFDAPMKSGRWGYFCSSCVKVFCNISYVAAVGTKLVQRKTSKINKDAKPLPAKEENSDSYWKQVISEGVREVRCPICNEERRLESDTSGKVACDGCGQIMIIKEVL